MPKQDLPSDATILDVRSTLANAEDFLLPIIGQLNACFRKHGNSHVRIGITGTGLYPSHKIQYEGDADVEVLFGAYSGRTPFGDYKVHTVNWSSKSMSYDEVKALLREIRMSRR